MDTGRINNKQISINLIANVVSYAVNLAVAFVLTPYLVEKVGKETYSFYPIANSIVNYLAIIMLSMNTIASRFVTVALLQNDKKKANDYFLSSLLSNLIISLIVAVPMVLIIVFLEKIMNVPVNALAEIRILFVLLFSSSLVNIIASVFGIATFAKNRIDLRSLRELIVSISKLLLYLLFYSIFPPSIVYIGIVIFLVGIINVGIQIFYTKRLLPEIRLKDGVFSINSVKELFFSSVWTSINSVGNQLLVGMSVILANVYYGAEASGEYSLVNTVPQFLSGVIAMLVGVFYPVIMYYYAKNDHDKLMKSISNSQNIVGVLGCSVATVFAAMSPAFFSLWMPGENSEKLALLTYIVIVPYIVISCMWTLVNLNIVMNKVKIPAMFTLTIGIVNIAFSFLAYKFQIGGVFSLPLISTLLQLIWICGFMTLYVSRIMEVKALVFYKPLIRALPCVVIVFIFTKTIERFVWFGKNWLTFIISGIIIGSIALIVFSVAMIGPRNISTGFIETIRSIRKTRAKE